LHQAGRIAHRLPHLQEPLERPAPLSHWHLDVKDASTVPADPDGKRQHVVEVLNTVDEGTSVLVGAQVGADLHAETTVGAVAELFMRHGLPEAVRMDRDGRFVSSPSGSDFPSALVRFCQCLGVSVFVCDPRHPQQNGFVERYHRTFQEECLAVQRPVTLEEVREAATQFEQHYNYERPLKAAQVRQLPATAGLPDGA
jgi:transposase InsO family protein